MDEPIIPQEEVPESPVPQEEQLNTEASAEEIESSAGAFFMPESNPDAPEITVTETVEPEEVFTMEPQIERDWAKEFSDLAKAHPEATKSELPDDIWQAIHESSESAVRVYETMMLSKLTAEIDALRKENATLRHNAEASARAPVTAGNGSPNTKPEDEFLRGFNIRF